MIIIAIFAVCTVITVGIMINADRQATGLGRYPYDDEM